MPPNDPDDLDRRDLAECAKGESAALRRLWDRHAGRVNGLALRMVRRRDWAEDMVQETFLKVWKNAGAFRGESKPGTWIASIALNEARMRLRGEARRPAERLGDAAEDVASPEVPEEDERLEALRRELAQVAPEERELLLLAAQGLGYDEIGKLVNLSPDQVRGRLYRARKALAEKMKGGGA
ncbi:MAG: sigma-70 family RNA polymerase sigma factor [Planctomycetes bacterium]|nr:sigma-70 family RNA polymerase sigma factor [Planctomycetota bacterium]